MAKGSNNRNCVYARRRLYSIRAIPIANRKMNRRKNRGPITAANKNQNLIWAPPLESESQQLVVGRPDRLPGGQYFGLPNNQRWRMSSVSCSVIPPSLIPPPCAGVSLWVGGRACRERASRAPHEIETGQAAAAGQKIWRSYAPFPLCQPF